MIAAIRIRGKVGLNPKVKGAFVSLSLNRVNQLVLLPENDYSKGQLRRAQDYITFGVIDAKALTRLLEKRGRLPGQKRLDEAFLKGKKFGSFEEMAKALLDGKATMAQLGLKKVFRLHPPRKGFGKKGISQSFTVGGALGERGEAINALIKKMS